MTGLIHGGDLYGYDTPVLDFSSNTNPLGLPESVKAALAASIGSWERYPDPLCRELTGALAKTEKVEPAYIHFGNGAADLFFRIAQAKKPQTALITAPAFAEYERALKSVGCEIHLYFLHEKDNFALTDAILKEFDSAPDIVILCSPNNPTGQPVERELMLRILEKCAALGITLVVDECFNPFLDEPEAYSLKDRLCAYPNLVIVGAFTKLYAMAGLRLGYLFCSNPGLIREVNACGQPWSVSMPAQIAGITALGDAAYLEQTRELIPRERLWLSQSLQKFGMAVMGSKANYIFFKTQGMRDLKERLLEQGILIRSCANYHGLDGCFYRVAVKTREENERLTGALAKILDRED